MHATGALIESRVEAFAWPDVEARLDASGWAMLEGLLTREECAAIAALYAPRRGVNAIRARLIRK